VTNINKHAEATHVLLTGIISSLDRLDDILAPGERIDHPDNKKRYPGIAKMRRMTSPISPTKTKFG
jgi:hypothetical protein